MLRVPDHMVVTRQGASTMYVRDFACLVLLGVFATSLLGKGRSRSAFRGAVDAARHLTGRARPAPLVVVVLLGEAAVVLGAAAGLALGDRAVTTIAALLAGALLAVFTAALVAAGRRGEASPCPFLRGSTPPPAPPPNPPHPALPGPL